mmetsp:Transcript_23344/g.49715  ORF Transcript_23344/g.49715 Transcript_23344/m.49715 type:complete len:268 (-) Transcript_23344:179-982(-)
MIASEVSGRPIVALAEAIRMSAASASSRPPPTATPSMAAMNGMGREAKRSIVFRSTVTNSEVSSWVMVARSFRSAPAEKTLSEKEVTTRHRQPPIEWGLYLSCLVSSVSSMLLASLPPSSTSKQFCSSCIISRPIALAFGRLRVILVTIAAQSVLLLVASKRFSIKTCFCENDKSVEEDVVKSFCLEQSIRARQKCLLSGCRLWFCRDSTTLRQKFPVDDLIAIARDNVSIPPFYYIDFNQVSLAMKQTTTSAFRSCKVIVVVSIIQ